MARRMQVARRMARRAAASSCITGAPLGDLPGVLVRGAASGPTTTCTIAKDYDSVVRRGMEERMEYLERWGHCEADQKKLIEIRKAFAERFGGKEELDEDTLIEEKEEADNEEVDEEWREEDLDEYERGWFPDKLGLAVVEHSADEVKKVNNERYKKMDENGNTIIKTKPRTGARRVLVTGGAGFVGSHLCDALVARGDYVICLDSLFTGSKDNIKHHFGKENFEFIRHDVVEPILLEVDEVYHLACPASPIHYKFNPVKTIKTSVIGTMNMLGLAKRTKAKFLLTSTSEVYGDPLQHPQTETYWGNVNPIGERSCYDEGKRCAETLAFDYYREHRVPIRVARIFNTYGPRMALDDGRVVSNFVSQALTGTPMTVYGDGQQTRSFQYVSDLVAGLMALMDGDDTGPINLGNPGEFTMLELAEKVKEVVNPKAEIVLKENTQDDPSRRKPDISKAMKVLGWEPKIRLEDGLLHMIGDFKTRLGV